MHALPHEGTDGTLVPRTGTDEISGLWFARWGIVARPYDGDDFMKPGPGAALRVLKHPPAQVLSDACEANQ
jgi:hypothetical protein